MYRAVHLIRSLFLSAVIVGLSIQAGHSRSLYQRQIGNHEIEVEFDAYYSNVDYYIPLTGTPVPCCENENEFQVYRQLFSSPVPRFLVFEVSVNPMPCLGVLIRRNRPDDYARANLSETQNLVRSITAGFEDPWAASLFLGNVISFRPRGREDCEGKGYIGLLASAGNYHIKDNELIDDQWREAEIKIKGDRILPAMKVNWSFRTGFKHHDNPFIQDAVYFGLRRDRVDVNYYGLSLFRNTGYEYMMDVNKDTGRAIRHYFRIGKKIPFKNSKIAFTFDTGVIWESAEKYTGPLRRAGTESQYQVLMQPNIVF